MNKRLQNIINFDLTALLPHIKQKVNTPFFLSFITTFILLNILFLYHGSNFMIGDHDWKYLQHGIPLTDGFFEGRFSQFIFINLLSLGKILPIINNILSFLGFSLGISLLAKYWQLPNSKTTYILFSLFTAITPFVLLFMYFAFITIPCLSWNAIVILSLIISQKQTSFSLLKTLISSLLITISLGGYPPVINLIALALSTRMFIDTYFSNTSLKTLIRNYKYTIINILLGIIFYKLILYTLTLTGSLNTNYYNLQTIPFSQYYTQLLKITHTLFKQFEVTLPFIPSSYKLLTLSITILAIISLFTRSYLSKSPINIKKLFLTIILFIAIFYSPLITLFLSASPKETMFAPRIDFFGLMYLYSAMFMFTLRSSYLFIKNISITLAILTIFTSQNLLLEAQKVWKLGFEAELKTYRRIINTYEQFDTFNQSKKYTIINTGYLKLREKFYHTPYTQKSDDLLNISYIPGLNAGTAIKYQTLPTYTSPNSYIYTFTPDQKAISSIIKADTYPNPNSISIGDYWIMIILNNQALHILRRRYLNTQLKEQ